MVSGQFCTLAIIFAYSYQIALIHSAYEGRTNRTMGFIPILDFVNNVRYLAKYVIASIVSADRKLCLIFHESFSIVFTKTAFLICLLVVEHRFAL